MISTQDCHSYGQPLPGDVNLLKVAGALVWQLLQPMGSLMYMQIPFPCLSPLQYAKHNNNHKQQQQLQQQNLRWWDVWEMISLVGQTLTREERLALLHA